MTIELDRTPEPPLWPPDVRVRSLDDDSDLQPIHEAQQEVFPDRRADLDSWLHEYEGFDPSLCFVAEDAAGIAGFALCLPELAEDRQAGYVSELGVRLDRRGRGSASRSCGRRSSSSTRAGAPVSRCTSTWTT